eukprot:543464-Ditylum_brightwellii.AAC.1
MSDTKTSTSSFFYSRDDGKGDNNPPIKLEDVPHYLQSRNLIPTPFGSRFSILGIINNDSHDSDKDNGDADDNDDRSNRSSKKEVDDNANMMAKGWKIHASAVQREIEHVLMSSLQPHQTSNDYSDNAGDETTVATPTDNHDVSSALQ